MNYYPNYNYNYSYGNLAFLRDVLGICAIAGLVLAIVLMIAFLPARNKGKFTGFAKWLYEFLNFNKFLVSSIVKILFIVLATVCFIGGFICLFSSPQVGLGLMLTGIFLRMLLELCMVSLSIRENTAHISEALTQMSASTSPGSAPREDTVACPHCGTQNAKGINFCRDCGAKLS